MIDKVFTPVGIDGIKFRSSANAEVRLFAFAIICYLFSLISPLSFS